MSRVSDWNLFKSLRNRVNNMKKYAKDLFFNNLEDTLCDLCFSNPREYWKIVKLLMKENSYNCDPIPPLYDKNGSLAFTDFEKANALNDFFVSVF